MKMPTKRQAGRPLYITNELDSMQALRTIIKRILLLEEVVAAARPMANLASYPFGASKPDLTDKCVC